MFKGSEFRSACGHLVLLACGVLAEVSACAGQNAPSAASPFPRATPFLSLLPAIVEHSLAGTQRSRDLAVDVESFQSGAFLFARARLSPAEIIAAFGRPVRDLGIAQVRAGELPSTEVHLKLDAMIDLGSAVEITATVSWASGPAGGAGGHTMLRILFIRSTNGYRFASVTPLLVT